MTLLFKFQRDCSGFSVVSDVWRILHWVSTYLGLGSSYNKSTQWAEVWRGKVLMLQLLLLLRLLLFCFFSCCCCGYLSNHCASRLTMTADGSDGGSWNPRRVVCTIAFAEPRDCVCSHCRRVLSGIRSILMRCHGQILRLALQSHLNLCNGERTKSNWVCRGFCHHWRMR